MFSEDYIKKLDETILEMTKESQNLCIEWIFKAIDATRELEKTLYEEIEAEYNKVGTTKYPSNTKYNIKCRIIEDIIGFNKYNVGIYYTQRGVRRGVREEILLQDVEKDFTKKRASLRNKILKIATSNIKNISNINLECNNTFSAVVDLEDGNKIIVSVISAGGWNIQKFHFRNKVTLRKF